MDGRMGTFLACHDACAGDRFIWGGDFNTGVIHISAVYVPRDLEKADGPSPVLRITAAHPPLTWGATRSPPRSAAQLATSSNVVRRPATPRVNAIFGSDASAEAALQELLEKIGRDFLFGKVANIAASSDGRFDAAAAPHIPEKLEEFLRVVEEQRANQLRRTPGLASDAIFTSFHMQEIHKEWMNDYGSWMNAETVQEYERLRNGRCKGDTQKAHQLRRSAFSAYLFQIIGNKHVLLSGIQRPICSAAQPADAIRRFMDACEQRRDDEDEGAPPPGPRGRRSERAPGPCRAPAGPARAPGPRRTRSRSRTPRRAPAEPARAPGPRWTRSRSRTPRE